MVVTSAWGTVAAPTRSLLGASLLRGGIATKPCWPAAESRSTTDLHPRSTLRTVLPHPTDRYLGRRKALAGPHVGVRGTREVRHTGQIALREPSFQASGIPPSKRSPGTGLRRLYGHTNLALVRKLRGFSDVRGHDARTRRRPSATRRRAVLASESKPRVLLVRWIAGRVRDHLQTCLYPLDRTSGDRPRQEVKGASGPGRMLVLHVSTADGVGRRSVRNGAGECRSESVAP